MPVEKTEREISTLISEIARVEIKLPEIQRVNGQVAVPGGGQLKVPTPRVDQVLFRVVPPLARASRMR